MNDNGLPSQMPPPPHAKLAGPRPLRPPKTRIPRVFSIWGTLAYSAFSIVAFASMIAYGFGWRPPGLIILPALFYVGTSAGIITMGRIEANKEAKVFTRALSRLSDENKRRMN